MFASRRFYRLRPSKSDAETSVAPYAVGVYDLAHKGELSRCPSGRARPRAMPAPGVHLDLGQGLADISTPTKAAVDKFGYFGRAYVGAGVVLHRASRLSSFLKLGNGNGSGDADQYLEFPCRNS